MKLTPTRKLVLQHLVHYVYLTTHQFYRLFNATEESQQRNIRYVLNRFSKKEEKHLIERQYFTSKEAKDGKFPVWEYMYWLTPYGIDAATDLGIDAKNAKAAEDKSPLMLPHEQGISDVHIALGEIWWRQSDVKHTVDHLTVSPDALFFINGYYYFLEFENSKPGHYRNRESSQMRKARQYVEYAASGAYKHKWPDMKGFYVLFVVLNNERRDNLIAELREHHPKLIFLVASLPELLANPKGTILRSPLREAQAFV